MPELFATSASNTVPVFEQLKGGNDAWTAVFTAIFIHFSFTSHQKSMSLENSSMAENALTEATSSSFIEQASWPSVLANASAEIGRHSESVMLSVPQSPSIEHLRRVPKSDLAADSAAGQALRRKIMRGSVTLHSFFLIRIGLHCVFFSGGRLHWRWEHQQENDL